MLILLGRERLHFPCENIPVYQAGRQAPQRSKRQKLVILLASLQNASAKIQLPGLLWSLKDDPDELRARFFGKGELEDLG